MSNPKKPRSSSKTVSDETKVKHAIDFLEELSWLIDSKKSLKLSEIPEILRDKLFQPTIKSPKISSLHPNIHYLIGILPSLFKDITLFGRNEELAEFAKEVLGIEITRIEKRSRYELIGLIICEANEIDDTKLENLVDSLSVITGSSEKIKAMAKEKTSVGFSWNETIRKLAEK